MFNTLARCIEVSVSLYYERFFLTSIPETQRLQVPTYTKEDGRSMKMLYFGMQYKSTATFPTEKMVHNQYPGTRLRNVYPIEPEFNARRAGRRHWTLLCERENGVNLKTLYFEPASRRTANVGSE
jgi:hypothetical protein